MNMPRMHKLRPFPRFKLEELPEDEQKHAAIIPANISNMHSKATDFWSSRSLIDHCTFWRTVEIGDALTYHKWQLSAARDCAMSIYHFGKLIDGLEQSLSKCKGLIGITNNSEKKAARNLFDQLFPDYIHMRNALSHSAERYNTYINKERHGKISSRKIQENPIITVHLSDSASTFILEDNLYNNVLRSTWNGKIVSCSIDNDAGNTLDKIIDLYCKAFDRIYDDKLEALPTVTVSRTPPP